ncbi:putative 2-oxoglutarate-dependent dioxygenase [Spathaspora sp. JA1]|nr:putative 2-oxoglutarate-dependent dioxygenase [Spathaspora sp. JA1]
MSFHNIPILDLNLAFNPETKPQFLEQLRDAMINVGFLLLKNYESLGPNEKELQEIKQQAIEFFALPDETKLKCEMINSPHFLGYSRLANEITASHTDWREQIDLGTELPPPKEGDPIYKNIEGPNLWPEPEAIPNFRPAVETFQKKMTQLSETFRYLVLESIGLDKSALDGYFKPNQQCKMKLIAYPDSNNLTNAKSVALDDTPETQQGCGPHRDSDLITYIYQASSHQDSLQVQNFQGEWVTVPNIPGHLVVNNGQTMEAITQGVCKATIHRVLIPKPGSGTRISIPFFQTIDLDSSKSAVQNIPQEIINLKDERDKKIKDWAVDVGFQFKPDVSKQPVGYAVFKNRIKSHQDVAQRWYPEILKEVLQELR